MNPYEVLGVSEDADEETIKKAYRELVKKYHPDKYVNNPLADLASEKLKEINKAYDMLMNKSGAGTQGGADYSGTYTSSGSAQFREVRILISQNRIHEAMTLLSSLPRTAEWYYLMGRVYMQQGWYDKAVSCLRTAVNMDPNNVEYRSALENVTGRARTYSQRGDVSGGICTPCNCCTAYMCADCLCPCF